MNKTHLDQIYTETTLPTTRKLFHRQPLNASRSRDSSKKSLKDRTLSSQISFPYIRMNLLNSQSQTPLKLNATDRRIQNLDKRDSSARFTQRRGVRDTPKEKQLTSKVQELLEETIMRQEELNQMTVQKENLLIEVGQLRTQVKILEDSNAELRNSQFALKESLKKMTRQKNSLQTQKAVLLRKITQLETELFAENVPSAYTLRQQYLEKEVIQLRQRLDKQKSETQRLLQTELCELRQKLFNANKLIENLRINSICLQQKNDAISKELKSTPELMGLRSKYKKTLGERNELKKSKQMSQKQIQTLIKENSKLLRQLDMLKQLPLHEESLNFSMVSNLSERG